MMRFPSQDWFSKFCPTEKDEGLYEHMHCINQLHYYTREDYGELLGKLCFLAGKTLYLETAVKKDDGWGKLEKIKDRVVATTGRIEMQLNHFGFLLIEKCDLKDGMARFIAERMPRVDWDEKKELYEYDVNIVVSVPLTHPTWQSLFKRHRTEERKAREQEMIDNFKLWYFAPLEYCRLCRRVHQGSHRAIVARELNMKTVPVRIRLDANCPYVKREKK